MKEKFQEWQQLQEDAIQKFMDSGYSREAAENLLDRIEDLHSPGIIPKMHKEEE
jgi:hypothetical protein